VKPIEFSTHALGYRSRRGFTREEVEDAIRTCSWKPAEAGRLECRKNFQFEGEWNGKRYSTKQVRPIFVEEGNTILVVTVYTYYF
jgi:hypothetical protein